MLDEQNPDMEFDPKTLQGFLTNEFGPAERFELERIGGGQSNPTFFVTFGQREMVLRKQPPGEILKGAHAIDREFRVLTALTDTNVPTPRPILYHQEADLLGTPFYLMERLQGRVFSDCALPDLTPTERRGMYLSMAEAMAKLHAVRPEDVDLADYGRPGNYFERQIARWSRQYIESPSPPIPALDCVMDWLKKSLPEDDGAVSIAHGDFRLGNMIFHANRPEVIGILDWELSTLGHPLADLGFCCMPWITSPEEYGGILGVDISVAGIPTETEFVEHYFAAAAPTSPLLTFHKVFALFRFAVIFIGIADRATAGNASSKDAQSYGPLAGKFATRSFDLIK